ncbi:MAG TPA: GNAT family N-acetyltransferase [Novosphingobium sp.]|nr:GNAT family N-acetyltransferase [Novosphingobium sp.]
MSSAPLLKTERLELWRPQPGDLGGLNAINTDPRTLPFLGSWTPSEADSFARLMRNAGSWSLYGYGVFMLRRRGEQRIIGTCGVFHSFRGFGQGMDDTPEAGWIIHPDDWGQGLAGEAMRAVLDWFDSAHGPRRIACMIEEGHAVSDRLAGQLGFVEYTRHQQPDEKPLVLYERLGPPATE